MFGVENFIDTLEFTFALSGLIIFATFWGYQTRIDQEKTSIYECGFTPYQSARNPVDVKFYLVSLLFIVFDVEVLFLFPIALVETPLTGSQIGYIIFFVTFMFLGIVFEIRKKALET